MTVLPALLAVAIIGIGIMVHTPIHAASRADELLERGIEARRKGRDAEALERFREAYKIDPSPRALAQMGLAEQALGQWMIASQHLRRALSTTDDPWIRKHGAALEQALTEIDSHLGQLDITGIPAGADVLVDGEWVGTLPFSEPLRVSIGTIVVDVRREGYVPVSRPVKVSANIPGREYFSLRPVAPTAVAPPPATPANNAPAAPEIASTTAKRKTGARPARIVGWTSAVFATGALGWGIYEHLTLRDLKSRYEGTGCFTAWSPPCPSLDRQGKIAETLMFVGYGLAAALTATSIISFALDQPPDDRLSFACAPTLGATGGAFCAVRFR